MSKLETDIRSRIDDAIDDIFWSSRLAETKDQSWLSALHRFAKAGKKVRPLSLLLATCCQDPDKALTKSTFVLAACIELAHRATLISDDLADGHLERKGQPTLFNSEGKKVALFCGQLLQSIALEACPPGHQREINSAICDTLLGQVMQERFLFTKIPEAFRTNCIIVRLKSSSLGTSALRIAAELTRSSRTSQMNRLGLHLAMAYQTCNDLSDLGSWIEESTEVFPSDLLNKTFSYPILLAIESERKARQGCLLSYMTERQKTPNQFAIRRLFQDEGIIKKAMLHVDRNLEEADGIIARFGRIKEFTQEFLSLATTSWRRLYLEGEFPNA